MNWFGGNIIVATIMCRADHLPGDIGGQYLNKKKTYSSYNRKVACFFHPVVFTKNIDKLVETITGYYGEDVKHIISKALQRVHV